MPQGEDRGVSFFKSQQNVDLQLKNDVLDSFL